MKHIHLHWIGLAAAGVLAACVVEPPEVLGGAIYQSDCAGCHGPDARGGGAFAHTLSRTPPDLTRLAVRNGGAFPRDYVMGVIDGFDRGSHFAPDMPAFGDGDLGHTVIVENDDGTATPIPERLLALADHLEGLQRQD